MNQMLAPARAVRPGSILRREIEARGWTQKDLAKIMERPVQAISAIVQGRKQITPETALELAAALGTSAELWNNLEANYRLHLARESKPNEAIRRKGRLYSLAPIREMQRRGWLPDSDSVDDLENELCAIFGVDTLDEVPDLSLYPELEWREGPGGWRAGIRGTTIDVYSVAGYVRLGYTAEQIAAELLPQLSDDQVSAALRFYNQYREGIDRWLADSEQLTNSASLEGILREERSEYQEDRPADEQDGVGSG